MNKFIRKLGRVFSSGHQSTDSTSVPVLEKESMEAIDIFISTSNKLAQVNETIAKSRESKKKLIDSLQDTIVSLDALELKNEKVISHIKAITEA